METPAVAITAPMTRPITKRARGVLRVWSWLMAIRDGVAVDATGSGTDGTVSGNMT
jgi:hypothetical protein